MPDSIRKNCSPRVYFDEPVELQAKGSDAVIRGRALNLSVGGIYVCSTIALPERCRVELVFALPGGGMIQAEARVLRVVTDEDEREPAGMALGFCSIEPQAEKLLELFVASRLEPAQGEPVRLLLGDLSFPIAARTQACFEGFLSVDAELPFLRLSSPVTLARPGSEEHGTGSIRWVSIHVVPETGVPRINIGIELGGPQRIHSAGGDGRQGRPEFEARPQSGASAYDEEYDPVCSVEFSEHSHSLDQTVRAQRRQQSAAS